MTFRSFIFSFIFIAGLFPSLASAGSCREWLSKLNRMTWVFPEVKIAERGNLPLFEGDPRRNLESFIRLLAAAPKSRLGFKVFSSPDRTAFENILFQSSLTLLNPEQSQNIYGKNAESVKVIDGFREIEKIHFKLRTEFISQAQIQEVPGSLRLGSSGLRRAGKFSVMAIGVAGLAYVVGGIGAPLWDPLAAWTRKNSFIASNWLFPETKDGTNNISSLDPEFGSRAIEVYRLQNEIYSGVDQIVANRVSYFETSIHQDWMLLHSTQDLEAQKIILRRLQSLQIRFWDILKSKDGAASRESLDYIRKTFDPGEKILTDLAGKTSDSQERK